MFKLALIFLILYIVFVQQKLPVKSARVSIPKEYEGDPYNILGISMNSTDEDIRVAYRELSKKNHPDLVAHMSKDFQDLAEKKVRKINWAYQEIKKTRGF